MALKATGIAFFLALLSLASAGQARDTIIMYNGQILIGEVIRVESGVLSIKEVDLKNLKIRLNKIRTFRTSRAFKIETTDREVYYGVLQSSKYDGWIDVMDSTEVVVQSIDIMSISLIVSLERNFFKRLNGSISAGISYTKSSDNGQVNLSSNVISAGKTMSYQLSTSEYISFDSTGVSRDREHYQLFATYNFSPEWFAAGLINYQRNIELSLASRFQQMIGAGNKTITKKDLRLYFISGLTFSTEKSTEGTTSGLLMEVPLMLWFSFFKFKDPNLQVNSSQTFYVNLSQAGRIRVDGNTTLSWELVKDFKLNFNVYDSYDNQPPSGGNTFDYGFSLGLGYAF
jgi:hypothetical protein